MIKVLLQSPTFTALWNHPIQGLLLWSPTFCLWWIHQHNLDSNGTISFSGNVVIPSLIVECEIFEKFFDLVDTEFTFLPSFAWLVFPRLIWGQGSPTLGFEQLVCSQDVIILAIKRRPAQADPRNMNCIITKGRVLSQNVQTIIAKVASRNYFIPSIRPLKSNEIGRCANILMAVQIQHHGKLYFEGTRSGFLSNQVKTMFKTTLSSRELTGHKGWFYWYSDRTDAKIDPTQDHK